MSISLRSENIRSIVDEMNKLEKLANTGKKKPEFLLLALEGCFESLKNLAGNDPKYGYAKRRFDAVYESITGNKIEFSKYLPGCSIEKDQSVQEEPNLIDQKALHDLKIVRGLQKNGYISRTDEQEFTKSSLFKEGDSLYEASLEIEEEDERIEKEVSKWRSEPEVIINDGEPLVEEEIVMDMNEFLGGSSVKKNSANESFKGVINLLEKMKTVMGKFLDDSSVKESDGDERTLTEAFKDLVAQQTKMQFNDLGIEGQNR